MSGFVGILHRDGRPVDPGQLRSLTESLRFRGPDGLRTWHRGSVGLGHTLFVTHAARDGEPQPIALDDRYWIVGHIRLDAREDLIGALCHSERSEESLRSSDAALVLRAYRAWGPECVKRIHGDFSFGIWDEANQRLFCARDPFGVRPFFYAQFDNLFLFSNTLNCLRQHPRVSDRLHEPALADYLMVGHLLEMDRSYFVDIRRLPPAHTLTVTARDSKVERYWSLPIEPELRYRKDEEYLEHFAHLMSQAVADRCPPGPLSLFLSGGLDSAMIAAALTGKLGSLPAGTQPRALCLGWNSAFADPEPAHARITAAALGLTLEVYELPLDEPFKGWDADDGVGPEPEDDFYRSNATLGLRRAAANARVAFYGSGGDEIFARELLLDEMRRAPTLRLAGDALKTWITERRPPLGLRSALRRLQAPDPTPAWQRVPEWLDSDWVKRNGTEQRLRNWTAPAQGADRPARANARSRLGSYRWPLNLESGDCGLTGVALEARYPFLDHRLVDFALRLPVFPWCMDKNLQRRLLRRSLPEAITERPKTLLAGDPFPAWVERNVRWPASCDVARSSLDGRVRPQVWADAWAKPAVHGEPATIAWRLGRVSALQLWQQARVRGYDAGGDRAQRFP